MKKSFYNIIYNSEQGYLLFNSLTNSLVILDEQGMDKYNTDSLADEEIKRLYQSGFFVDDDIDEVKFVEYHYLKNLFNNQAPSFRVYTTLACNAQCNYCYEKGTPISNMSKEVADSLVEFVAEQTKYCKQYSIRWFGGEPLLNWKIIDYISDELKKKCNADLVGYITTNGSLFNDELIEKAKGNWGIKNVQISLDGYGELHNKIKAYKDRDNGFSDTITNIVKLLDKGISVDIRLNVTKSNAGNMLELIDYLALTIQNKKLSNVYAYPVFDSDVDKVCCSESEDVIKENELHTYFYPVVQKIESVGWKKSNTIRQRRVSCWAIKTGNYVISPNGDIYKCSFEVKDPSNSIGNVKTGIKRNAMFLSWGLPRYDEKCYQCKFLPMCQGGCKYQVIHNSVTDCRWTDEKLRQSLLAQISKRK